MRTIIYLSLILPLIFAGSLAASERSAARHFDEIKSDPILLRQFLYAFPKGGDLHNHIDGSIYVENMLDWAVQDGRCVDLATLAFKFAPCDAEKGRPKASTIRDNGEIVGRIIDSLSVRNYQRREKSGSDQFFSTFPKFFAATTGREGDMLAEVTQRAADQNIGYLELMQSWKMGDARASVGKLDQQSRLIEEAAGKATVMIDKIEAKRRTLQKCDQEQAATGCKVQVRYLAQILRSFPRDQVRAQTKLAVRMMEQDPRVVGLNFVQPEHDPISLRDYKWQMAMIAEEAASLADDKRNITLHAGELALGLVPPEELGFHIRDAIEIAGATRIGHGVDVVHDPKMGELLEGMASKAIAVEINLSSNDVILGISGDQHPFNLYRRHGVPLTISTDDEGVSRIDLTHEYQRAVETYDLNYNDVKNLARNALEYSFLQGDSLFRAHDFDQINLACANDSIGMLQTSRECEIILLQNPKANAQWNLEGEIDRFEKRYSR